MFTGIVTAIGRVAETGPNRIAIADADTAAMVKIGDSVAVNGACLTVTEIEGRVFFADIVPETLRRTNLGLLNAGDPVNLERSLTLNQAVDGHLVQGHVDACARVREIRVQESGAEIEIELPAALSPYVAEKGSIAVDGTSLTVAAVSKSSFTIAFIPHTLANTVAQSYRKGSTVNLEADVLARYADRILAARKPSE